MQKVPMPSPKNTNYENLSLPSRGGPFAAYDAAPDVLARVEALLKGKVDADTITRVLQIARGGAANDADPERGDLIEALLAWAARELTPEQASALNTLIENNSDPRAAIAGQSEDDPNSPHYKPDGMSMDSRRRAALGQSSSLSRAAGADSYAKMFPQASLIIHG
jgi:hypothetical protein